MIGAGRDPGRLQFASLDDKAMHEWHQLTGQVLASRTEAGCARVNVTLAVEREPQSPLAPAYRLWMADNLARDGELAGALRAYDAVVERAQSAERLIERLDPIVGALYHKENLLAKFGLIDKIPA
jgi:hypothetical protein